MALVASAHCDRSCGQTAPVHYRVSIGERISGRRLPVALRARRERMAGTEISSYAAELQAQLAAVDAEPAQLVALATAAGNLAAFADRAPGALTSAEWNGALAEWNQARDAFGARLASALLGPLAAVPGLAELVSDLGRLSTEGIHGGLDLGPVRVEIASSVLVVQAPAFADIPGVPPAVAIGPYQVGQIAAALSSPFDGKGMPGGGSLLRLPEKGGYGGELELPLGPVQVSAAAVLATSGGQPSFLAILGAQFIPPIQLSFGFSLDRVGGLIGINRRADNDALTAAVRTGVAGDVLFAVRPPAQPLALATAANRLFPIRVGTHLVGPSLRVSWLSFGQAGNLIGIDLVAIVEVPTGKVGLLGVARVAIPGLPMLLDLRLDLVGLVDPVERSVTVSASLVDSHVLGVFEVYGDAVARFSWGTAGYFVVSIGGFYPGFNPEPARLPPLRRAGMAMNNPLSIISIRSEGYLAVTSNSIQFGGRLEVGISLGIEAHGFVQVDAIVQFRPFRFEARIAAGFSISVEGFSFASVGLHGAISGPGPVVIRGSLSVEVFLFSLSWDETFTLGSGPGDLPPPRQSLLAIVGEELGRVENLQAESVADPEVVLRPRAGSGALAAVPPTGALRVSQRRAPLGLPIDRVDGRPLGDRQGVTIAGGSRDVTERFAPGSYATLTDSEALSRPPFDVLPSGRVLSLTDPPLAANATLEDRKVEQIVMIGQRIVSDDRNGVRVDLSHAQALVTAAGLPPALSDNAATVIATGETWTVSGAAGTFASATAAHQHARYHSGVALAATDAAASVELAGV
jgi:hypothetical protein